MRPGTLEILNERETRNPWDRFARGKEAQLKSLYWVGGGGKGCQAASTKIGKQCYTRAQAADAKVNPPAQLPTFQEVP